MVSLLARRKLRLFTDITILNRCINAINSLTFGMSISSVVFIPINIVSYIFLEVILMKNSILILSEHRRLDNEPKITVIIQQAVTAWLTKELYK